LLIIILFSKSCRRLSILSFIDFKWLRYPWQTAKNITHMFPATYSSYPIYI
jgi:hypothetical protein